MPTFEEIEQSPAFKSKSPSEKLRIARAYQVAQFQKIPPKLRERPEVQEAFKRTSRKLDDRVIEDHFPNILKSYVPLARGSFSRLSQARNLDGIRSADEAIAKSESQLADVRQTQEAAQQDRQATVDAIARGDREARGRVLPTDLAEAPDPEVSEDSKAPLRRAVQGRGIVTAPQQIPSSQREAQLETEIEGQERFQDISLDAILREMEKSSKISPSQSLMKFQQSKSPGDYFKNVDNPMEIAGLIASFGADSMAFSLEAAVPAMVAGTLTGGAGAVLAGGAAGARAEYLMSFSQELVESIDGEITKDKLLDALRNEELVERIHKKSLTRSGAIGITEGGANAVSFGIASKLLQPARKLSRSGFAGRAFGSVAAETAINAAGGSSGEFVAMLLTGKNPLTGENLKDVFAEGAGGLSQGPAETVSAGIRSAAFAPEQSTEQIAADLAREVGAMQPVTPRTSLTPEEAVEEVKETEEYQITDQAIDNARDTGNPLTAREAEILQNAATIEQATDLGAEPEPVVDEITEATEENIAIDEQQETTEGLDDENVFRRDAQQPSSNEPISSVTGDRPVESTGLQDQRRNPDRPFEQQSPKEAREREVQERWSGKPVISRSNFLKQNPREKSQPLADWDQDVERKAREFLWVRAFQGRDIPSDWGNWSEAEDFLLRAGYRKEGDVYRRYDDGKPPTWGNVDQVQANYLEGVLSEQRNQIRAQANNVIDSRLSTAVNSAVWGEEKPPVSAAAVEEYEIRLPEGYERQGDLYVYTEPTDETQQTQQPAPAQDDVAAPEERSVVPTIDREQFSNELDAIATNATGKLTEIKADGVITAAQSAIERVEEAGDVEAAEDLALAINDTLDLNSNITSESAQQMREALSGILQRAQRVQESPQPQTDETLPEQAPAEQAPVQEVQPETQGPQVSELGQEEVGVEPAQPTVEQAAPQKFEPIGQGNKVIHLTTRPDTPTWQVTRFIDESRETPAGHDGFESLPEALKAINYRGPENQSVEDNIAATREASSSFLVKALAQDKSRVLADARKQGTRYTYASHLRPPQGIRLPGLVVAGQVDLGGGRLGGVLVMDKPLSISDMGRLDLAPIDPNAQNAYYEEVADEIYPSWRTEKAGASEQRTTRDQGSLTQFETDVISLPPTSRKGANQAYSRNADTLERLNGMGVDVRVVPNQKSADALAGKKFRNLRGVTTEVDGKPTVIINAARLNSPEAFDRVLAHEAIHGAHRVFRSRPQNQELQREAVAAFDPQSDTFDDRIDVAMRNHYRSNGLNWNRLSPAEKLSETVQAMANGDVEVSMSSPSLIRYIAEMLGFVKARLNVSEGSALSELVSNVEGMIGRDQEQPTTGETPTADQQEVSTEAQTMAQKFRSILNSPSIERSTGGQFGEGVKTERLPLAQGDSVLVSGINPEQVNRVLKSGDVVLQSGERVEPSRLKKITAEDQAFIEENMSQWRAWLVGGDKAIQPRQQTESGSSQAEEATDTTAEATTEIREELQDVTDTEGKADVAQVKRELLERIDAAIESAQTDEQKAKRYADRFGFSSYEIKDGTVEFTARSNTTASGRRTESVPIGDVRKYNPGQTEFDTVEITIPGDGTFTIANTKEALGEIRKRVKKMTLNPRPLTGPSTAPRKAPITSIVKAIRDGRRDPDTIIRQVANDRLAPTKTDTYSEADIKKLRSAMAEQGVDLDQAVEDLIAEQQREGSAPQGGTGTPGQSAAQAQQRTEPTPQNPLGLTLEEQIRRAEETVRGIRNDRPKAKARAQQQLERLRQQLAEEEGTGSDRMGSPKRESPAVTPSQDAAYLAAVERGDMETAQRMVDEAARKAGYTVKGYHGSPDFQGESFNSEFLGRNIGLSRGGFSFAPDREAAEVYMMTEADAAQAIVDEANRIGRDLFEKDRGKTWRGPHGQTVSDLEFRSNAVDDIEDFQFYLEELADSLQSVFPHQAGEFRKLARRDPSYDPNPRLIEAWLKDPKIEQVRGRDVFIAENPSQIKSADPVTRDESGNVIPLSQRFDPSTDNIYGELPSVYPASTNDNVDPGAYTETLPHLVTPEGDVRPATGDDVMGMPDAAFPTGTNNTTIGSSKVTPITAPEVNEAFVKLMVAAGSNTPIRIGNLVLRNAEGQYDPHSETIRNRKANDLSTTAHEVGHDLEKHLFNRKPHPWRGRIGTSMQNELTRLGKDLYGDQKPNGGYMREGFAEYVRLFITDPATLARKAPEFSQWMEGEFFSDRPDIREALLNAREKYGRYSGQDPMERAQMTVVGEEGIFRRLRARGAALAEWWQRVITESVETGISLKKLDAQIGVESTNITNIYDHFKAMRRTSNGMAGWMVNRYMIDFNGNRIGDSLTDAIGPVRHRRMDLMLYMLSRRAMALHREGLGRDPGITAEDASAIIKHIENDPEGSKFQVAADKIYRWQEQVLDYVAAASPEMARVVEAIRAADPGDYLPLKREFKQAADAWNKSGPATKSVAQRLRGSNRRIKNPFESIVMDTVSKIDAAHDRFIIDKIVMASDEIEGLGNFISEVPARAVPVAERSVEEMLTEITRTIEGGGGTIEVDPGMLDLAEETVTLFSRVEPITKEHPIFAVRQNGTTRYFEVQPDLMEALRGMKPIEMASTSFFLRAIESIGRTTARSARLGITGLRATFSLVTNPLRDAGTAYMNTRAMHNPFVAMVSFWQQYGAGFRDSLTNNRWQNEWAQIFDRLGGGMAQPIGQDINAAKRETRRLFESKGMKLVDPRNAFDLLVDVLQFPEKAARLAEMKAVAKQIGWDPSQPLTREIANQLLLSAKEVSTDFSASGSTVGYLNTIIPFLNAAIQGPRASYRALRRNPTIFMAKGIGVFMALTLANWWRNKDEDWWEEMPADERYRFTYIRIGSTVYRIPRPFELGGIFMALPEAMADAAYQWSKEDPEERSYVPETLDAMIHHSTPNMTPPVIAAARDILANHDFFFDRPLMSFGMTQLPADEQFTPYTTNASIKMGQVLNKSPIYIDHAIEKVFGPAVTDFVGTVGGRGGGVTAEQKEAHSKSNLPVIGTMFLRDQYPTRPVSVQKFFDEYEEISTRARSKSTEETEAQREHRLGMIDARKDIITLFERYRDSADEKERMKIKRTITDIAKDALKGNRDRPVGQPFRFVPDREDANQGLGL